MNVDVEVLKNHVDEVTLIDMAAKINTTHVLLDDYPQVHIDLSIKIVQGYYGRIIKDLGDDAARKEHKQRALDTAKWFAINRLTTQFHDIIDRSTFYMLTEAEQTGWYRSDWFGHDELKELLASIYDATEHGSSTWYDWRFIVEQLVPAAERFGIPPGDLMSASVQIRKIRSIVPDARNLLERHANDVVSDEEAEAGLRFMLDLAKDPKISNSLLREKIAKWQGRSFNRPDPINSHKFMIPSGHTWFIIETSSAVEESMIEQALRNRANFKLTDLGWMVDKVRRMVKGE
jgi:hypothetical protein